MQGHGERVELDQREEPQYDSVPNRNICNCNLVVTDGSRFPVRLSVTTRILFMARQVDRPVLLLGVVEREEKDTFDSTPAAHRVNILFI